MPTQLQLRRGTTNQHNTFTGVVGEVTINTTKKTAVVHDGSTAGGLELLRADMSNIFASATPTITSLNTSGDVSVGGNLTVTGTTTFNGGTITMGDADTDNVVFGADVNSNILPNTDNTYALGSSSKKWSDVRSVLLTTTGDATIGGDVAINGGDLTTSQTTFNLLNTTATTLNVGGASTATAIGAATGTTTVKADLTVDGDVQVKGGDLTTNQTTFNLLNTTATTLNVGGAATTLEIGAATGTTNINNNLDVDGDVNIDGGDLTVSTTTFNLANTTATTLNVGGAATSLNLGAGTGTTTVNNNLTVTGDLTVSGNTTTLNTATLEVEDKNIIIAKVASPTDSTADGAGITIKGATDKTFNWVDATDAFTSSEHIETAAGKTLALSGSSSGKTTLNVSAAASGTLTLPAATDTLVGKATSDTLTNKSISLTTNTITGTTAEFNTALSDDNFVTLTGTETLTNKTLTSPVISSVSNSGTLTLPTSTDTLVGRATTDTLTNKSISLTTNTITATSAELATAISDETGTGLLVFGTSPTLTTPVISTITNTGTLTLPTSTDTLVGKATTDTLTNKSVSLTTNTITGTLAEFNTALSDDNFVSLTGTETLTNKTLTTPVITTINTTSNSSISLDPNGTGVVNVPAGYTGRSGFGANSLVPKSYVDALEAGLHVHQAVKAATTDTLAVLTGGTVTYDNGTAGNGATLTLENALTTLDTSYTVVSGDRILIKNQANAAHNGIYTIDATRTILTRSTDFDSVSEVASGDFLFVSNGTQFGNQGFVQTVAMVTFGSTNISFTQFSGAGQITAGNGLTKDGNIIDAVGTADRITVNANSIDIASTYAGQSTITTLGTIASGTWNGSIVNGQYGGTGVNNSGKTLTLGGNFTHTGAHTLDLTTTANTSITLPTTGTLTTLNGSETLANKTLTSPVISSISNSGTITIPTGTDTLVGRATTDTLTNKTLTSPVISSITNTGTLTLPTSTDTLVGRATTDTLTNKTLTSPVISSITNTGTLTLPTSTDTLVGRATTDTLTNKTLTSPVISSISNSGTLTLPTSTDTLVGRATTDTLTNKTIGAATISGNLIPNANATIDLGSAANKFRHLYLDGSSFFMGTTKISMHNNGYFVFNSNSAGSYPEGSNVSVATATNGIAATNGTAAAFAIALGG
jgi:hypothetical protein